MSMTKLEPHDKSDINVPFSDLIILGAVKEELLLPCPRIPFPHVYTIPPATHY